MPQIRFSVSEALVPSAAAAAISADLIETAEVAIDAGLTDASHPH
jgi:hypothetical protein